MAGNTADNTTLRGFLKKFEREHGKAQWVWVMDRGIPTKDVLAEMRKAETPVYYLVGTPKEQLSRYEQALLEQPWKSFRDGISVKLLQDGEVVYICAQSQRRIQKERAMRRRRLTHLLKRLTELRDQKTITRDSLLMKLGVAQKQAGRAYGLVDIVLPRQKEPVNEQTFHWRINRKKYR